MYRSRPMWIETRVPARVTCTKCKAKFAAVLDPASVENSYSYKCEACGSVSHFTLAELNDPALTAVSVPLKRISA